MSDMKIKIGDKVPDFELSNQDGQPVRLASFIGTPVAIFVYPKADTPG
jgi:peroxiredoxin Q/BCP